MPNVRAADLEVAYALDGAPDAPVLVLGNSLGTSLELWDDLVAPLAREYRVLRYDMRGHGGTRPVPADGTTSVGALADDVVALLDALGIERVRYAGISLGGMVAQRLAAAYPQRVAALALLATGHVIGTAAVWDERIARVEREGLDGLAESVLARWFTPRTHAERPELIARFGAMLRATPPAGYAAGCRAVRDADLGAGDRTIAAPALILAGAQDAVTPPAAGEALRGLIPGARLEVVDGAAHIIPAEQPAAVLGALLPFLRAADARAGALR